MDTGGSAENHRSYQVSTHVEFRGGVFHGAITVVSGGPKKRTEILEWISTVPYTNHHMRISDDRLAGTGGWILEKKEYSTWRKSSKSMLLLLRGIPGAGKTYLASQVIDWFLSNPTAESKLAYFYCNRAEETRRDPESILRTLIQQLAQTPSKENLLTAVLDIYKEREEKGQLSSRLTLKECQNLLVQLMAIYPQTTICIDALDEVDHKLRLQLLKVLKHVVDESSTRVKIFATTRMDTDILLQFEMFPRIELQPDDNVDDINRFVKEKVQEVIDDKQLLHGAVPIELQDEICQVLCERSKGMFQLAALQVTLLCDMAVADDVRNNLKVLPQTLTDAYNEIYNRIRNQEGSAPRLALNAFRWVQCSYEPLASKTLLDAVTVEIDGSGEFSRRCTGVSATDLLKVCQNLLILDERLDVFRFAHLSVEEYWETRQLAVDSHAEIAKICLSLLCTLRSWTDYGITLCTGEGQYRSRHLLLYSAVFWPWHLHRGTDSCQILAALWEAFLSEAAFQRWIAYHRRRVQIYYSKDTFWLRSDALQRGGDRLSTVCVFGLWRKITSISISKLEPMGYVELTFPSRSITETIQWSRVHQLLISASKFGDLNITQHLLDAGAEVSTKDKEGLTPLRRAVGCGHEAVAQLLLDRGADVSAVDEYGRTPLHSAVEGGDEAVARLLLDRGADASAVDRNGWTPLHRAVEGGNEAVARLLLDRGAAVDGNGRTTLHRAVEGGDEAVAPLLLDRGADVSAVDGNGWTPLHRAAVRGHEALARLLLDRGADVSAVDGNGWTPLQLAAVCGSEAVARMLVDRGADVSAVDGNGWTPLHRAVEGGNEAVAQLLLDRGADASAVDRNGWTPLHRAAQCGREAVARLLVDRGADVSAVDGNGWTPLHLTAHEGHQALAILLLDRGADVSAAKGDGWTPLHLAAQNGHEVLARLLLDRGAAVLATNDYGWTPLQVALACGHEALVQLLADATHRAFLPAASPPFRMYY